MFGKPSVQIEKIEKVELRLPIHPLLEEAWIDYMRSQRLGLPHSVKPFTRTFPALDEDRSKWSGLLKGLDYATKIISIVSGLAVIVFVVLLIFGQASIGSVQIKSLLTLASFALVGGIISIGGVKMFSFSASLQNIRKKVEATGCPFVPLLDEQAKLKYDISSPFEIGSTKFCNGCHLVDKDGRTVCQVSPYYAA